MPFISISIIILYRCIYDVYICTHICTLCTYIITYIYIIYIYIIYIYIYHIYIYTYIYIHHIYIYIYSTYIYIYMHTYMSIYTQYPMKSQKLVGFSGRSWLRPLVSLPASSISTRSRTWSRPVPCAPWRSFYWQSKKRWKREDLLFHSGK